MAYPPFFGAMACQPVGGWAVALLPEREGKRFFFEKKKQKTSIRWSEPHGGGTLQAPR
jgi:hypothetical protein